MMMIRSNLFGRVYPRLSHCARVRTITTRSRVVDATVPFTENRTGVLACGIAAAAFVFGQNYISARDKAVCESSKVSFVTEHYTGTDFESKRSAINGVQETLVGVSVRCMLGMCQYDPARAYAVGLYADETAAKPGELSLEGGNAEESHLRILNSTAQKTLLLKFDKNVKGEHVAKGFDRALIRRLRELHEGAKQHQDKPHLRTFLKIFTSCKDMRKGTEIEFTWVPGSGQLHCSVRDQGIAGKTGNIYVLIESENLARCLFDTYLGSTSVFTKNARMHFTLDN